MKNLLTFLLSLTVLALLATSCASPVAARAYTEGTAVVGFDGSHFAAGGDSSGQAWVSYKTQDESVPPLYFVSWTEATLVVADIDADFKQTFKPGEQMPGEAIAIVHEALSVAQVQILRDMGYDV